MTNENENKKPVKKQKKQKPKKSLFKRIKPSLIFASYFYIAILTCITIVMGYKYYLLQKNISIEPKEIERVEVIKYVEKSKTPTSDFLMYLNPRLDPEMAKLIGNEVNKASEKYILPRKLICSIMRKESNIDPFAKSSAGAVGLMQVMPKIHKGKIGERNIWHIRTNIDVGCQIWREYFDKSNGNIERTFHSYLSKNASKKFARQYQNDIENFWAMLEMYDYLTTMEREKTKEDIQNETKEDDINKIEEPLKYRDRH